MSSKVVVLGGHTPAASEAVRWALRAASTAGAEVVVVHPFDRRARADLALEHDLVRARRDARYRAHAWLVDAVADLDVRVPVSLSTPDGSAAQVLATAAADADLVVLGDDDPHAVELAAYVRSATGCPVRVVARPVHSATGTAVPS